MEPESRCSWGVRGPGGRAGLARREGSVFPYNLAGFLSDPVLPKGTPSLLSTWIMDGCTSRKISRMSHLLVDRKSGIRPVHSFPCL